eukprot:5375370-Pyramimonas_sp.AAC.1
MHIGSGQKAALCSRSAAAEETRGKKARRGKLGRKHQYVANGGQESPTDDDPRSVQQPNPEITIA